MLRIFQNATDPSGTNPMILMGIGALVIIVMASLFAGEPENFQIAEVNAATRMPNGTFVRNEWFAAEVSGVNRNVGWQYGIQPGTKGIVLLDLDGNAEVIQKLHPGDVITGVNRFQVQNVSDFRTAIGNLLPGQGMLLDVHRNGRQMYVTVSGAQMGGWAQAYQNPHPFTATEVAPFLGRNINVGGFQPPSGVLGKRMEKWIGQNFGSGFYACGSCGTLVPIGVKAINGQMTCPNCGGQMVSR